ncbi:MAG: macro domain-containing protein, partial [Candidatus Caldarchaeum sp.]
GGLKARHVIHAVEPRMGEGEEDRKLRDAVLNSLMLADLYNLKSIAFPAISTGAFGYPVERAVKAIVEAVADYLARENTSLERVLFVLYDEKTLEVFSRFLTYLPSRSTRA